jgi:signal transduction histidine kinase
MEALSLLTTRITNINWEKISRVFIGQIYSILDFIAFFSPFVLVRNLTISRAELLNFKNYIFATGVLFLTFLAAYIFDVMTSEPRRIYLFLTAPVIINGLYGGVGPALYSIFAGAILANLILMNYQLSNQVLMLNSSNLAFIIEALFLTWISISQKRRNQSITINLLQEQTARIKAQSDSLNLKRLERQKDDFIAIAAHELKNPLASAKAFTQILKTRVKSKTTRQYASKLGIQIERLDEMVNQLFDVSSMTTGQMELKKSTVFFDELVMATVIDLQHTIFSHQLTVAGHTKSDVYLDPDRIREVIVNLVTNAVKYSPKAKRVVIHLGSNKDRVNLAVQDFGEGIAPNEQRRIFERFYRTQSHRVSGLGLGLYIVSEIVRLHHGRIWLNSTQGKGSTFFVSLPK